MDTQALIGRAIALHRSGSIGEAELLYLEILVHNPKNFLARQFLGVVRAQQGRFEEGLAELAAALAIRPEDPEALLNHANILKSLGRYQEALMGFERVLALRPDWPQALNNRATVLKALGRFEEALANYDQALVLEPNYVEALNNRGSVLQDLKRPADALASYDRALQLQPGFAAAYNNRGTALMDLKRFGDALGCFERALALRGDDAEVLNNRGNALQGLLRYEEAVASYDKALRIRPDYGEALNNRGTALQLLKRYDEALSSFERAGPAQPHAFGGAAMAALNLCDWRKSAAFAAQIPSRIEAGEPIPPWMLLGYSDDEKLQLKVAQNVIASRFPTPPPALAKPNATYPHARIRLAYISSDFCHHPVATQIAQLIECHDRGRFEVFGISTGADDGSAQRRRLAAGFEHFCDMRQSLPLKAAQQLREMELDIVIDLNGHTAGDNFDILVHRPAPVQASWLGYAGTTGAGFIDFAIADKVVAPHPRMFSEKLVYLPDSFFVTDTTRAFGPVPRRRDMGLNEDAFVFCCFNQNWKFTAEIFSLWMRILSKLPDSVLWLRQPGEVAESNLRRFAQEQGVDPKRLVFAANARIEVHLARHQLADLFLDTLPYNAHATACDALWAGLPVLTSRGKSFAGRVAASLLGAVGLPELITENLAAYEDLALALACNRERLAKLRRKLGEQRARAPLFDTIGFARKLERAIERMINPSLREE